MSDSALERSVADAFGSLGRWVREHDRMVVLGLLFSLLPLPPACFVGLLLSLANVLLLRGGRLPSQERKLVSWAAALGAVNSAVVIGAMVWVSSHVHDAYRLVHLPFVPDAVDTLFNRLLEGLRGAFPPASTPTVLPA